MKFGISTFVNDDTIDPVSLARAIEERGFHSLAIAEHTHIPASRETAYPLGGAPTIVGVSATVLTSYMFVLDLDGIIARLRPASSGVAA
jgi:alkanesulfonate monooxygenase SsuD/methylene tetrahydromethanopterin reductase-like flavin-dependent oxidoreductase (luciferase family)